MSTRVFKQITSMHSVPLYAVVLASLTSFALLVIHMVGWELWKVAILILIAWLPSLRKYCESTTTRGALAKVVSVGLASMSRIIWSVMETMS